MTSIEKIKSCVLDVYKDELVSLYVYGENYLRDNAHHHVLIVLKSVLVNDIRGHAKQRTLLNEGMQFSIFTEKELRDSVDVFPIEFLLMNRSRQLLFGVDVLDQLQVSLSNLRHECEYTLRSNLLKLRSALLVPKVDLNVLVSQSAPVFFASFGCFFVLLSRDFPASSELFFTELSALTKINLDDFVQVLNKKKIDDSDFQLYIDTLSKLTDFINEI
jgi:hypothetical protein